VDDACDGAGACTDNGLEPDGTACGDPTVDQCNDADTCQAGACAPNWVASGTPCDDGLFCNENEACDGAGACAGGTPNPCGDGVGCTDDSCDEAADACVNAPNDGSCDDGLFCNGAETCDALLDCQPGTPPVVDDGVGCTDDSCDEVNDVVVNEPNDANCPDDGLFCNGTEFCDPVADCSSTGDPCLGGEVCNEEGDVCEAPAACGDGTLDPGEDCDDGNTLPGDCCAANCTFEAAGTACGDPSDTECDNPDSCDGAGFCEPNYEAPGFACGDQGIECLVDDSCDGAGACTDNGLEPDGTACGDPTADQCDNADSCLAGVCEPNWVASGTPCDDGLFCNENEACDGAGACGGGTPNPCGDGVGCTDDSCDEAADACVNTPNDANCDDGEFCNGAETCDALLDCQAGTPPDVDDGVGCTDDSCDEVNDVVVNTPNDANCDDGLFCNGAETCDATLDCQPGTPPDVDDGVGCTVDSCDEVNDVVVNEPNDGLCPDDGLFCTGTEFCDPVNDCQSTGDPCAEGETCNEEIDVCEAPPAEVDLDVAGFRATKRVRLGGKKTPTIELKLVVKNGGAVDEPRRALITGVLPDGTPLLVFDEFVSDAVGDGRTTYTFNYTPPPPPEGVILWTAEIFDDDPDTDTATATTTVVP
jgi:hypothetical protein